MGNTDKILPAPATAPYPGDNFELDRRYAINGKIMAFVVIFLFLAFLSFLILAPHLKMLRKRSISSSRMKQNSDNVSQRELEL